jgi:putative FmdB family regulatory protein
MPTYEYRCPAGHEFEKFYRKISDAGAEVPCPQCGRVAERKISAGAGLVFKGSGFYITDYGKDGKKDQPAAARAKSRDESGGDGAATGGDASGGGDAKAGSETKTGAESTAASPESKPAPAKEAAKKSETAVKSTKPTKPSTE